MKFVIDLEVDKKEKKPRPPSDYNTFVKNFLADEKKRLGSDYDHKVAFKDATVSWSKNKSKV